MKTLELALEPAAALSPSAFGAGTYDGASIDTRSFEYAAFVADVAAVTAATAIVRVQESDDASEWTTIPDLQLSLGVADATTADEWIVVRLATRKRYLRVRLTVSGTLFSVGIVRMLWNPLYGSDQGNPPTASTI